jgi:glycosyltransferase involved in cell wall biosynthesis
MHVLYLHQYFMTPEFGGATRSYSFAKHLIKNGHEVTMVISKAFVNLACFENKRFIEIVKYEDINLVAIDIPYFQKMSYMKRVMSFIKFMIVSSFFVLKKNNYDLVFATSTPISIGIPGLIAKWRHNIPFIFEVRDLWPEYPENFGILKNKIIIKILEKFSKLLYYNASKIIGISNSMLNRIEKKYKLNSKKLIYIPIGCDLETATKINEEMIQRIKLKYQLENKFVIGYAGTIGFVNHLENIVKLAQIFKNEKDIIFLIGGDGKERKRLEDDIKKRNLNNIFFLGKFDAYGTFSIINTFDICLFSVVEHNKNGGKSINGEDALSNKFFDYIASGKPILMTAKGEITNLMEKFKFGYYLDMNDDKKSYELIHKLKANSNLRRELGHNAKKAAKAIFDRKKLAEKLELVLQEVIKDSRLF